MRTGVYQKYDTVNKLSGRDFFIMHSYLREAPEQTDAEVQEALESIFNHLHLLSEHKHLEYVRNDLKGHTPSIFESLIDKNIDSALLTL